MSPIRQTVLLVAAAATLTGCYGTDRAGYLGATKDLRRPIATYPSRYFDIWGRRSTYMQVTRRGTPVWPDWDVLVVRPDGGVVRKSGDRNFTSIHGEVGRVTLLTASSGRRVRWRVPPPCSPYVGASGPDGQLFLGCEGAVAELDSRGQLRWTAAIDGYAIDGLAPAPGGGVYVYGSPTAIPDVDAEQDEASLLLALGADGAVRWRDTIDHLADIDYGGGTDDRVLISAAATASDGTLYVGTNGHLTALNPDGAMKWQRTTKLFSEIDSILVAADGTVYVGEGDAGLRSSVLAFTPSGEVRWAGPLDSNLGMAFGPDGSVYVDTGDHVLRFAR